MYIPLYVLPVISLFVGLGVAKVVDIVMPFVKARQRRKKAGNIEWVPMGGGRYMPKPPTIPPPSDEGS